METAWRKFRQALLNYNQLTLQIYDLIPKELNKVEKETHLLVFGYIKQTQRNANPIPKYYIKFMNYSLLYCFSLQYNMWE